MTTTTTRARVAPALLAALAGAGWLVLRPTLLAGGAGTTALAVGYLLTGAIALNVRVPAATGFIPRGTALALGLAAVSVAALLGGWPVPTPVRASALLLSLLAAVSEELVFRRALFGWLSRHGALLAVVGSASLFALVHVPAYGVAALPLDLGAGLLLSWQRWATGSWAVPAFTHVSANALAVIL